MWEARCPPPPGAGHAPGSSDSVTDLLCRVNDILPALGGNGPSPQSCLFFLNSQTQAAREWAVYSLCARPRRQAIRDAELHIPPTAGDPECQAARPPGHRPGEVPRLGSLLQDGRLQRTCLSPQYIAWVSLHFLFAKAASWTPAGCGGRGRPSLGARLHWERGQPAATPRAMAICPGREGAARHGGEDRSGLAVLVLGRGWRSVQPRCSHAVSSRPSDGVSALLSVQAGTKPGVYIPSSSL